MINNYLLLHSLLVVRNLSRLGVVSQDGERSLAEQPVISAMIFRSSSIIRSE